MILPLLLRLNFKALSPFQYPHHHFLLGSSTRNNSNNSSSLAHLCQVNPNSQWQQRTHRTCQRLVPQRNKYLQ